MSASTSASSPAADYDTHSAWDWGFPLLLVGGIFLCFALIFGVGMCIDFKRQHDYTIQPTKVPFWRRRRSTVPTTIAMARPTLDRPPAEAVPVNV